MAAVVATKVVWPVCHWYSVWCKYSDTVVVISPLAIVVIPFATASCHAPAITAWHKPWRRFVYCIFVGVLVFRSFRGFPSHSHPVEPGRRLRDVYVRHQRFVFAACL